MYQYTDFDRQFVRARAAQFRDQLERNLAGELGDDEFRPLRLQNGWDNPAPPPALRNGLVNPAPPPVPARPHPVGRAREPPAAPAGPHGPRARPRLPAL